MSSLKTTTNLSNSGMNKEFMWYMKCVRAFVKPKDMTRYSQSLYLVEKAIFGIFSSRILRMIAGVKINLGEHLGSR
jgi:hypothetical protein